MKEQLPSPDFDASRYARPNQNWICGHAAEGQPCRVGPDGRGRCRASFECQPVLEIKEGETKGRYRCTRSAQQGGPCSLGPLPDGTCCRPVPKCIPVRSLRAKRGIFTLCVVAFTVGVLLVGLSRPFRAKLISPGELSAQHGSTAFSKMSGGKGSREEACSACHQAAPAGLSGWFSAGLGAVPGPFQMRALASTDRPVMTALELNCLHCHTGHSFHQPNVAKDHSCAACHHEHIGSGPMPHPPDDQCRSCHASAEAMEAAYLTGKSQPAAVFDYRPKLGRVLFKVPRPDRGYTKIIHSFDTDHPEFQVLADKFKDLDSLKFNHELHLSKVTQPDGRKLACADCHKPDAAGVYYLKISYEESCRSCHPLQFDVANAGLVLPHGDAARVRDFLRSLTEEYAEYARKQKGITTRREIETFVQEQMKQIREQSGSGEELEQRVFFSDARTSPVARIGDRGSVGAARFPGCAYCHEVKPSASEAPQVTKPVIPDRWLIRSRFAHGKHFKVACETCHDARNSRETSEVILPSQAICARCHSAQGGVAHDCSTCHGYHSPRKEAVALR